MKIYIMRHGEAGSFAASDAERALTPNGIAQSVEVASASVNEGMVDIDLTLVSPYLRAQQTWEAIQDQVKARSVEVSDDITPYGQADDVYQFVVAKMQVENLNSVLLVSHLPLVGYLTAEFVDDMSAPMFPTSGIVCIDFDLQSETGAIDWHIHP